MVIRKQVVVSRRHRPSLQVWGFLAVPVSGLNY